MKNQIGIRGLNKEVWTRFKEYCYRRYGKKRAKHSIIVKELEKAILSFIEQPTHTHIQKQSKVQQNLELIRHELQKKGIDINDFDTFFSNSGLIRSIIEMNIGADERTILKYSKLLFKDNFFY